MATKKPKSTAKSKSTKQSKPKTATDTAAKTVSTEEVKATSPVKTEEVKATVASTTEKKSIFSGFFSRKYEEKESVLTIFKNHKFYGALLGEVIGTMLITILLFSLSLMGLSSLATYSFAVIAIFIAVYAFSGACLNPIITAGMMASRRMSVIRGVMYIVAEVIGAWLGWLIMNSFQLAGGDTAYPVPTITEIAEGKFFVIAMVEMMAAIIVAFFYARAVKYKRSIFTFAAIVAGGFALVMVVSYVISAAFLGANANFIVNPATALMMQIFPAAGENFGEIFGGICQALSVYAILPMVGGVLGFYLSDFTAKLSGNED